MIFVFHPIASRLSILGVCLSLRTVPFLEASFLSKTFFSDVYYDSAKVHKVIVSLEVKKTFIKRFCSYLPAELLDFDVLF